MDRRNDNKYDDNDHEKNNSATAILSPTQSNQIAQTSTNA